MDGIHDLGGMEGFGPVEPEPDEPLFHARWEARVFAMAEMVGEAGLIPNIDAFRHGVERVDPVAYLTAGYYGRWLAGIEGLLHEHGEVPREELQELVENINEEVVPVRTQRLNPPWQGVPAEATEHSGCRRALASAPRFAVGQAVRTCASHYPGHTRLPRYARDKRGLIKKVHGGWVFPDSNAHGRGENPQHLYTVSFDGDELWGADGEPNLKIQLDLFEPYLMEA